MEKNHGEASLQRKLSPRPAGGFVACDNAHAATSLQKFNPTILSQVTPLVLCGRTQEEGRFPRGVVGSTGRSDGPEAHAIEG